ncbi:hypothetical protein O3P69_012437 [Scylla paramamosain]|uniref:Uncharacterized protein n=1 Tax=Scylla paramamosain TaxID=85552 RepID=A0AAW0SGJ7_SCYPA
MFASANSAVSWEALLCLDDCEHQFETFLVAVGGNDFRMIQKKALLLHSVGAEAQRVFHSQPPAIKATDEDDYATAMRQLRYERSMRKSQEMEEPACNTSNFTGLGSPSTQRQPKCLHHGPVTTQLRPLPAIKGYQDKIVLKDYANPVRHKLRRLTLSVREEVSTKLQNLVEQRVIERIDASEWVSPVVVSRKIRLCVDLRGHNSQLVSEVHPLPTMEELHTKLHGVVFSQIDLRLLASIPGSQHYLDDIVCTGRMKQEHDEFLRLVMKRLQDTQRRRRWQQRARWKLYLWGSRLPGADALSRLPVIEKIEEGEEEYEIVALLDDEDAITDQEIQEASSTDEEILTLKEYLRLGFPESAKQCPQVIRPYFQFLHELSEVSGIVHRGMQQLIVSAALRGRYLQLGHNARYGVVRTKQLRSLAWWPGMNCNVENFVWNYSELSL